MSNKKKVYVVIGAVLLFAAVFGGTMLTLSNVDPDREFVRTEEN